MESHQLMQTSCWALRVSVLGRSSLGSLSTLLLGVQSIPKADSRSLGLNMKAGAKHAAEHLFPPQDSGRAGRLCPSPQGSCPLQAQQDMFPSQAPNARNVMNTKTISEIPEFLCDPYCWTTSLSQSLWSRFHCRLGKLVLPFFSLGCVWYLTCLKSIVKLWTVLAVQFPPHTNIFSLELQWDAQENVFLGQAAFPEGLQAGLCVLMFDKDVHGAS